MHPRSRIHLLLSGLLAAFAVGLLWTPGVAAQGDPTHLGDPSFANNAAWSTPSANVYISVREATGLPVSTKAMVKLSCPLTGLDVTGAAQGTSAQVQFNRVPVGNCNIEVSAPGYRTTKDRTEVTQSMTSHNQYVFIYLHPESESAAAAARAAVGALGLVKGRAKGMEAI